MNKDELVKEIKANFNLKQDKNVGKIASFVIGKAVELNENNYHNCLNKLGLTANKLADLIVELKSEVGLKCDCSGSCVSWYINKLKTGKIKKVETLEERKIRLEKELKECIKSLK